MIAEIKHERLRRWSLFLVGGLSNTALTWLIYLAAARVVSYQIAYLFAYVVGIAYSYAFNARLVFRVPLSFRGAAAYPLVYISQYLVSACFLGLFVEVLHVSRAYAPLVVTALMLPVTYFMSRLVLHLTHRKRPIANPD